MGIDMLKDFLDAMILSVNNIHDDITNVRYSEAIMDGIEFDFRGDKYNGVLKGRNADLVLGVDKIFDKGIACRVLLDGDAEII